MTATRNGLDDPEPSEDEDLAAHVALVVGFTREAVDQLVRLDPEAVAGALRGLGYTVTAPPAPTGSTSTTTRPVTVTPPGCP